MTEEVLIRTQHEIRESYYAGFITYKHAVRMAHKYSPADTFYTNLTLAALRDEHRRRWVTRLIWTVTILAVILANVLLVFLHMR